MMRFLNLQTVLVATELDDSPFVAAMTASELARAAGARLHVVCVYDHGSDPDGASTRDAVMGILQQVSAPVDGTVIHVVAGDPAQIIRSVADRIQADVVVLGAHREHRSRTHGIGGTALAVATDSSCPVLVASTPLNLPLSRVLVPVDLSDTARGALLVGLSWASGLRPPAHEGSDQHDVTLTALHIAPVSGAMPPALTRELDAVRQAGGNWAGVSTREETIASTDAAHGIATYAGSNGAELIVMGTRGLGLDAVGRLGSVAATVTRIIHVPVLLVPPAIWMGYVAQPRPD